MTEKALKDFETAMAERRDPNFRSIELDCPPGDPRPSDLLPGVLDGTGVVLDLQEPSGAFFGCWEWVIPPDQLGAYNANRDLIKSRVEALYRSGHIRYGSW